MADPNNADHTCNGSNDGSNGFDAANQCCECNGGNTAAPYTTSRFIVGTATDAYSEVGTFTATLTACYKNFPEVCSPTVYVHVDVTGPCSAGSITALSFTPAAPSVEVFQSKTMVFPQCVTSNTEALCGLSWSIEAIDGQTNLIDVAMPTDLTTADGSTGDRDVVFTPTDFSDVGTHTY